MFNFSGKGNTGLFGGETRVVNEVAKSRETRVDPEDNQPGTIDFWYDYALGLKNGVKGLINDKDALWRIAAERRAINAGLRGVIRELLKDLRAKDPNHPLLDKKNRDRIFAMYEKEEMDKHIKATGVKPWANRERPNENHSE